MGNSAKIAAIVGIVFSSIGIFCMIGMLIFMCCTESKEGLLFCFHIVELLVMCLPALIVGSIIVSIINGHNFDLTPLAQPGCTDPITTGALSGFTTKISSAKSMAASYLAFGIIGIVTGLLGLFGINTR